MERDVANSARDRRITGAYWREQSRSLSMFITRPPSPPRGHHRPSHGRTTPQILLPLRHPTPSTHRVHLASPSRAIAHSAHARLPSSHCGQFGSSSRNKAGRTSPGDRAASSGLHPASGEEALCTTSEDGGRGDELEAAAGESLLRLLRAGHTRDRVRSDLAQDDRECCSSASGLRPR